MRVRFFAALVLGLMGLGAASESAVVEAGNTAFVQGARSKGQVVDARSRDPIPNVVIVAYDEHWDPGSPYVAYYDEPRRPTGTPVGEPVTTDADGRFALDGSRAASLHLHAFGYIDGIVDLYREDDGDLGTIALEPTTVLRGRLFDASGPLRDAQVGLISSEVEAQRTTTDADGRFVLTRLVAEQSRWRRLAIETRGVLYEFNALSPGTLDFGDVRLPELWRVTGSVSDSDGNAVAGARVAVRRQWRGNGRWERGLDLIRRSTIRDDAGDLVWIETRTAVSGRFDVRVPSGLYDVIVQAPGGPLEAHYVLVEGADEEAGELRLAPPVEVFGAVIDESGVPVAGVFVNVAPPYGQRGWFGEEFPLPSAETDEQGRYRLLVSTSFDEVMLNFRKEAYVPIGETTTPDSPTYQMQIVDLALPARSPLVMTTRKTGIGGRVIDETGRGIAGVTLRAAEAPRTGSVAMLGIIAMSDDAGRFYFTGIAPGSWTVFCESEGLVADPVRGIDVASGRIAETLLEARRVPVQPIVGAPVDVQVVDRFGTPVSDVALTLGTRGSMPNRQGYRSVEVTRADGRARFQNVPNGDYSVSGIHDDRGPIAAAEFDIGPERRLVRLSLRPPARPLTTLSGKVVGVGGDPVVAARVTADAIDEAEQRFYGPTRYAFTDGTGAFRFEDLPIARYEVDAWRPGLARTRLSAPIEVPLEGLESVEITLGVGATITGRLVGLSPEEIRHSTVRAYGSPWTETGPVILNEDGSFRITEIGVGEWSVDASVDGGRHVAATVDVPSGVDAADVELVFEPGFRVTGRVLYEGRAVPAHLRFWGHSGDSGWRNVSTDEEGRYVIDGLPPDDYRITASARPMRSQFVEEASFDADTEYDIHVRGGALIGSVLDAATGEGVVGSTIRLRPSPSVQGFWTHSWPEYSFPSRDGRFRIGPLAGVPWRMEVLAEGYATQVRVVGIEDADVRDIVFRLERTTGLALDITDSVGGVPEYVSFYWQSIDGATNFEFSGDLGDIAEVLWDGIPMGAGIVTVIDHFGGLVARQRIENAGAPIDVVMKPAGLLDVQIETLAETDQATIELRDADGLPMPISRTRFDPMAPGARVSSDGRIRIGLPAGRYTAVVRVSNGREWTETFEATAGQTARLLLR